MKYANANSFKTKIKNIAKDRGIPAQQVQQNYLIEQVLRLISISKYKDSFIVKGGYLIGHIIGLDKRTTMDLDLSLKGVKLSPDNLSEIFKEVLKQEGEEGFQFEFDSLSLIRKQAEYGGFHVKINAAFDTLREVVFIDVTTGDKITPREIKYSVQSLFSDDEIKILSYNLETVFGEKLESVISRGSGSSRPRDRYDLFTLWKLRKDEVDLDVLRVALKNTVVKRDTMEELQKWQEQVADIRSSNYQKQLWLKYQRSFNYAQEINFEESVDIVETIMNELGE
ncbi:nucleotidyl transferase AbiEii/AbiGii toxin family protein [Enterococcus sp. RIT-PI-f]|uniref:nucleotidyl transferase AbiEii/AbiGii toxin family protein n=1 Tax=Enterococcus sp. RIT-PI-f TaxID=1690244 RepID=UPI0006B97165|nr:nucleotidyl transferase AbiEii/AbiGii toxin family protein [Enterococcus sp. RIT-PI-f]KPG69649.1 abortive phage infection protein [Enterococcus sp. RIT-PI-f]